MKRLLLALVALLLTPFAPAQATSLVRLNGDYTVGYPCTLADGTRFVCPGFTLTDSSGNELGTVGNPVNVTGTAGGGAVTQATASNLNAQVVGNIASGSTDSGNPIKVGGLVSTSTPAAASAGQRKDAWFTNNGAQVVAPSLAIAMADGASNTGVYSIASSGSAASGPLAIFNHLFNGATWDRQFTCPNSVSVNVTAGNTTEVVALTASTIVRVCAVSLGISASGTVGVVYGTGTNCGTGTTTLVADMNLTSGNIWSASSSSGSLFRTATSNALCVKAVTGNVTGVITYAKY